MISRRHLLRASHLSLCAPAIVAAASLMKVHTVIHARDPRRIGLYDRRLILTTAPEIDSLRRAGFWASAIADHLNARGPGPSPCIRLVAPWSARDVLQTVVEARRIRAADRALDFSAMTSIGSTRRSLLLSPTKGGPLPSPLT